MELDLAIIIILVIAIISFEFGCHAGAAAERDETLQHVSRVVGLIEVHQPRPARHYLIDVAMSILQRKHSKRTAQVEELSSRGII